MKTKKALLLIASAVLAICLICAAYAVFGRDEVQKPPSDELTFVESELLDSGRTFAGYVDADGTRFSYEDGKQVGVIYDNSLSASKGDAVKSSKIDEAGAIDIAYKYASEMLKEYDLSYLKPEVVDAEDRYMYKISLKDRAEIGEISVPISSIYVSVNYDGTVHQFSSTGYADSARFDRSMLDGITEDGLVDFVKSEMDPSVHQGEFIRLDRIYLEYNVDNGYYLNVGAVMGFEDGIKYAEEFFYPLS